jgi:hypothetical protein
VLPAIRRSVDEIVGDIAGELGGEGIEDHARALIGAAPFIKNAGPATGNRRANAELAGDLLKWIARGEKLFERLKGGDLIMFFAPPGPIVMPEDLERAVRQAAARRDLWLDALRTRCEWIIQQQIGEHGHTDHMQRAAAIAAAHLCRKAGKPTAWASSTSTFRMVASLVFEAMTGQRDVELERACEFAAHRRQDTDAK